MLTRGVLFDVADMRMADPVPTFTYLVEQIKAEEKEKAALDSLTVIKNH